MKAVVTEVLERDEDRALFKAIREDGQVITFHVRGDWKQLAEAVENPDVDAEVVM